MGWKDVCVRGRPGGLVREDQPPATDPKLRDAGGPSPGILRFIHDVVRSTPAINEPAKPSDFPAWVNIQAYPGRGGADVHFEGRAADIFLRSTVATEKMWGDWLFDWCVTNCRLLKIQGVKFGHRSWFSEENGGKEKEYLDTDHENHVHVELNCDGAAMGTNPPPPPTGLVGTWDVTIGEWSGIFIFTADRLVLWANDARSRMTPGDWTADEDKVYFQFRAPGDYRVFEARLPILPAGTSGSIIPAGQGGFQMTKKRG